MAKTRKDIEKDLLTSVAQAVDFAKGARKAMQKWQTGQGKPTGAAATLLRVIDANPRVVEKALEKST